MNVLRSLLVCLMLTSCAGVPAASGSLQTELPHATVVAEGNGPDVILIPGLSTPRAVWDATRAQLRGHYRVHSVQLRGFGDAAGANADGPVLEPFVDDIAGYIRDHHLHEPALIGHSMGGLGALMIAARHPELPGRVMVVDAAPFIGPLFTPPADSIERIKPMAEQLRAGLEAMAKLPLPPVPQGPVADPGEKSQAGTLSNTAQGRTLIAGWMREVDRHVVGRVLYDVMLTDLRPQLPAIAVPVMLVYAQDGRHKSPEATRADFDPQYAGVRHFTARQIPGSYHFVMLDQPQAFADAVHDFLEHDGKRN